MSLSGTARNDGSQHIMFIRRRFRYTDPGLAAGVKIGRLPANAFIHRVQWHKEVAFNSATSDNAQVGVSASDASILASTTIQGTGHVDHTSAAGLGKAVTTQAAGEVDVWLKWIGVGAAPSAGDVTIVIQFAPDNDG